MSAKAGWGWHAIGVFVAAHTIAWNLTTTWTAYGSVFLASTLGLVGTFFLLTHFIAKATRWSLVERGRWFEALQQLSITDARVRAERLLSDAARFHCVTSLEANDDRLRMLGSEARRFFERYRRVETDIAGVELNRDEIGPSKLTPGCLKIGSGAADAEIVIQPGQDEVFVIDGSEAELWDAERYPSLYHWLLAVGAFDSNG